VLEGDLGVRDAARLALQLSQAIAGPTTVDCTNLSGIDLAVVQVLLAADRAARAAGQPLILRHPAGGPLQQLLVATGFIAADGTPLTPDGPLWAAAEAHAA
jgi:anti-anti-sigma regulatory factor